MLTSVKLTKTNNESIVVSVVESSGCVIKLKHFGANRIYSEAPIFFKKLRDIGNGITEITLEDDVTLTKV